MKSLTEIWNEQPIKSDKNSLHSYLPTYEKLFAPYRMTAKNILELGVLGGASILLWEQFFEGKVYGVDIIDQPVGGKYDLRPMINDPNHNVLIFDVCDPVQLEKHFSGIKFDVIIEDCEHVISQQFEIYNALKPYIAESGIYVIEDIQSIDSTKVLFEAIDHEKKVEIIDLRADNGRFDNVIVTIR